MGKQLIQRGYLALSEDGYNTVELSEQAQTVLRERSPIRMKRIVVKTTACSSRSTAKAGAIECDEGLFEVLRGMRKELADKRGVPPYVIFGDVALRQMARRYPRRENEFLRLPGVGQQKLKEYGALFLQVVEEWLAENDLRDFPPTGFLDPPPRNKSARGEGLSTTAPETCKLFESDKDVATIASERGLTTNTIESHLASGIEEGRITDLRRLVTEPEEKAIREVAAKSDTSLLRPIFEALNEQISFGKIRLVLAKLGVEGSGGS